MPSSLPSLLLFLFFQRTPWRANMEDVFLFCDMLRGEDISEVLLRESVNFSGWPSSTERLRSVRWQLLLGTLPDRCPPGEFLSYATEAIKKQQQDWVQCIDLVEPFAPHRDTREGDKTSQPKKKVMKFDESSSSSDETTMGENPLVPAASTYYAQEHRYRILLREIQKDVERIFWEFSLFEKKSTKVDIETLLLAYCLLHDKDYKQGMHEIVAFCYFCVYRDRELLKEMDPMVRENYGEVMTFLDSAVEHSLSTTFALFCAILNEGDTFVGLSRFFYREERCEQSAVLVCAERVQQDILLTLDPPLLHLIDSEYGISSATYLIRWLRLLFIREFCFSQVLHIWDLIFAERYLHQRRGRPYFIENGIILYISAVMIKHVKPAILQGADSALRVLMKYPPVTDAFPALLKEAVILSNGALQPLLSVTSPTGVVAVDEGAVSRQGAKLSETIKTLEVILNRSTTDETAPDSLDAMVDCIAELKKIRDVLLYGVSD
ncbi:Rab-GTPase-TBC domain containing protein, putative [Angomonas deanei]|uniref:Rab-GTPase-TBC domain containing protein, putative n=1 Tax=Angomonas deanei TaxID=59799 RepID=A0A7G2CTN4_9TRYP|nr:Rab-GTPase-TBC domain containing protein, putative [Angomonas deanei]